MSEWISVKDRLPPKDEKFLFHYYCGIGLGAWGQCYSDFNNNSERTHSSYILVLFPYHEDEGIPPFYWDGEYLKYMDVKWQPLPEAPKG